jgi:capsular polysaccharide transport system permease protein
MIGNTLQIWLALMLRDIRTRRGPSRLTFLLALVEPLGQLLMVYVVFRALGRKADFGPNLFLFLLTGVLPYFQFTHIVSRIMSAVRVAQPMLPLRVVTVVDVAVAQLLVETLTIIIVGTVLLGGASFFGVEGAAPNDGIQLLLAVFVTSMTAFGVGLFNASVAGHFSVYRMVWTLVARSLIFFSSVFYVVETLPQGFRDALWWNPLLHGVIWFRTGIFQYYPANTLSYSYALTFCLGSILLGLSAERVLNRHV